MTPLRPKEYAFAFDQEEIDSVCKGLKDLNNQLTMDVGEIAVGYGAYYLKAPILLHAESDILTPTTPLNHAINLVITTLDAGVCEFNTDIIYRGLDGASWFRLVMATLAAINRGCLRSPRKTMSGTKSLNNIPDSFPMHKSLVRPLLEGGAIICMAEQLAGMFDHKRNRVLKDAFDHVWSKGHKAAKDLTITRLHGLAQPSTTTIEKVKEQAKKNLYDCTFIDLETNLEFRTKIEKQIEKDIYKVQRNKTNIDLFSAAQPTEEEEERARQQVHLSLVTSIKADLAQDMRLRVDIENKVKEDMYDLLKAECINDISEWRHVYRKELLTAM